MSTRVETGPRRRPALRHARIGVAFVSVAVVGAGLLLTACADCFFKVQGRLLECGTASPVTGATISVHIDEGMHGPRTLPLTFTTDDTGTFAVHTNGTETCDATATLRFEKTGYTPLERRYQGTSNQAVICMVPVGGDP